MEIKVVEGNAVEHATPALVVNLFDGVRVPGGATGAVDQALGGLITRLIKSGEKIHFFEVIQQRGAVRGGELKEYQAVIKVAVES